MTGVFKDSCNTFQRRMSAQAVDLISMLTSEGLAPVLGDTVIHCSVKLVSTTQAWGTAPHGDLPATSGPAARDETVTKES